MDTGHTFPTRRETAARLILIAMEALVLAVVVASPWAFGAVHLDFEFYLYAALAVLLWLWAARTLLLRTWAWQRSPVAVGLAALFLTGAVQLAPLPGPVLAIVAPGTARLSEELLPAQREQRHAGQPLPEAVMPAGQTLSLYPGATRQDSLRLLAVFLLFAIVRCQLASPAALHRLSVAAVVNGAALAFFAVIHFFSAPPQTLYWTYATGGTVFGPFVCRNHFSFYINLCLGLGLGLLLARRRSAASHLLNDPASLWLALALALMVTAVALSLSRGGLLALLLASLVCVLLQRSGQEKPLRSAGLVLGFLAAGFICWLGLGALQARLATLWSGDALAEGRLTSWLSVWPLTLDFPLWGTGLGTYQYVEPLGRSLDQPAADIWEHAHNDYLEALIEGGLVRLVLSVVVIALVYRAGSRAVRRLAGQPADALGLGAIFAFTTSVAHSFVDFGLHVPAIAWLLTVIVAQLCGLEPDPDSPEDPTGKLHGWRAGAAAATLALLGVLVYFEGQRLASAERFRLAARRHDGDTLLDLEQAVHTAPENATLHLELAEALSRQKQADAAATHYALARDLCPLLVQPQVRLAALAGRFAQADPPIVYLRRATRLRPFDAELWYLAGLQDWADGNRPEACRYWKQALTISDRYLDQVLERTRTAVGPAELLTEVLPDDPQRLLTAAERLYPREEDAAARKPFVERALTLLDQQDLPPAEAAYLRARLLRSAGQLAEAQAAYAAALVLAPERVAWRYELAELLYIAGKNREAQGQLHIILAQQPGHPQAQALLKDLLLSTDRSP